MKRKRTFIAALIAVVCAVAVFWTEATSAGTFPAENSREVRALRARQRAAQFLSCATFGPTTMEVEQLATRMMQVGQRRACEEWVDDQLEMSPSLHVRTIEEMMNAHGFQLDEYDEWVIRYRHHAFYYNALRAPDQLQQRAAWALAQIFVISDRGDGFNDQRTNPDGIPQWLGPSDYYDKLLRA